MARKVNWEKLKAEYVTGDISQRKLAEKYGVSASTLANHAKKEEWYENKKKSRSKVVEKAVQKAETKQANVIAKEIILLDKIEQHLDRAISDVDQFNRHIIQEGIGRGETMTEERIYQKMDLKAMKDAMQILTMIDKMKQERLEQSGEGKEITIRFENEKIEEWSK